MLVAGSGSCHQVMMEQETWQTHFETERQSRERERDSMCVYKEMVII